MKILRPFNGTGAVLFPIGKPPTGTCQYATKDCLKKCYARNDKEYDEELAITKDELKFIYYTFITSHTDDIVKKIVEELDGLQTPILHWFGTGDCLAKDIDKIQKIMWGLPDEVMQIGFTRNIKLWKGNKKRIALTVETLEDIGDKEGLFAIPDYTKLTTNLHYVLKNHRVEHYGGCGGCYYEDIKGEQKTFSHFINCKTCLKKKVGCFYKR